MTSGVSVPANKAVVCPNSNAAQIRARPNEVLCVLSESLTCLFRFRKNMAHGPCWLFP